MNRQLINGDCLEELKKLDDNSVDLLCTDPPYGYGFMGKHWDTFKEKDSTKSQQVGWMSPGMKKDTYGMKEFFDPIWKECLRVLKPGALAFVMSAPRSDVQTIMSQTLRDAGFDISFTPIYWTYASGFPKAMNIGKMIDKRDGNKREVIGIDKNSAPDLRDVGKKSKEAIGIDKLSYGQVENAERLEYEQNVDGRFPANMLVSDEVLDDYSRYFSLDEWFSKNLESLPEPVQQTFPFMIVPKASKSEKNEGLDNFDTKQVTGGGGGVGDYIDDVNSASGKFGSEKAPSRNIHPTVKPLTLMNYLVVLGSRKGDVVLEPFAGSGTTALACVSQERDYIAIEREEEYYEIAKARLDKVEQPLKMWEKFS